MTTSEAIESIRLKCSEYIRQYILESETSNSTPSLNQAVSQIRQLIKQWVEESRVGNDFSAQDIAEINKQTIGYGTQQMGAAYNESLQKHPRQVNGEQPNTGKEDVEEDVDIPIDKGKNYMKESLEFKIKNGVESGTFPSKNQISSFLDETIDEAIEYYATDLSDKSKSYIRNQLKKYKETLLRTVYEPQAKTISSSKTRGTSTGGNSGTDSSTGSGSGIATERMPVAAGVSEWAKTNISFSGCDMVVSAEMRTTDGTRVSVTIGSLQTLSYSIYRQLSAVKNIGNINAKDYVGGPRTIAGSMVFTVLNQHWGAELLTKFSEAEGYKHSKKILMDEIAPVDITVSMANEYGVYSRLAIYGVRFFSEGQVMSINDIYTENTFQYVALNLDYMVDVGPDNSVKGKNTKGASTPPPKAAQTQPINDGGRKTETSTEQPAVKPKESVDGSKIIGPDGEIMDLTKFKTKGMAMAQANERKINADNKAMSEAAGDPDKALKLNEENQKLYTNTVAAIEKYYDTLEKKIPDEVTKN